MKLITFLRGVRPGINWLAISTLIFLLLKILVFDRLPALFPKAYELGQVVDRLLGSVLASYVVYLIVVHAKEYSNRQTVYPYVLSQSRVVGDCESMLRDISKVSGISLTLSEANRTNLKTAFEKIPPASSAPLVIGLTQPVEYANWIQYFSYYRNRSKQSLRRIFAQIVFLDAELVSWISLIDGCPYFHYLETVERLPVGGKDLTHFTSVFAKYCELCKALSAYNSKALLELPKEDH